MGKDFHNPRKRDVGMRVEFEVVFNHAADPAAVEAYIRKRLQEWAGPGALIRELPVTEISFSDPCVQETQEDYKHAQAMNAWHARRARYEDFANDEVRSDAGIAPPLHQAEIRSMVERWMKKNPPPVHPDDMAAQVALSNEIVGEIIEEERKDPPMKPLPEYFWAEFTLPHIREMASGEPSDDLQFRREEVRAVRALRGRLLYHRKEAEKRYGPQGLAEVMRLTEDWIKRAESR